MFSDDFLCLDTIPLLGLLSFTDQYFTHRLHPIITLCLRHPNFYGAVLAAYVREPRFPYLGRRATLRSQHYLLFTISSPSLFVYRDVTPFFFISEIDCLSDSLSRWCHLHLPFTYSMHASRICPMSDYGLGMRPSGRLRANSNVDLSCVRIGP